MIINIEAECKDNGWVKVNMENHGGAGFLENGLRTNPLK